VSNETYEEKALFGEVGYRLTDKWQVTLGARWFDTDDDMELLTAFPFFGSTPGAIEPAGDRKQTSDNDVIFKLNSSYRFNEDVMSYLTISEGYRRGGLNPGPPCEVPASPTQNFCIDAGEEGYQPDTTTNYEFGLRSTWYDGQLLLNAAVYFIDWNDIQVQSRSETGGLPIIVNGSKAASKGVELTARWSITDSLELAANMSLNRTKLTKNAEHLVDGEAAFDGDRVSGSPEQQGSLLLAYTRPLDNGLTLQADYAFTAIGNVYTKVGLRNNGEVLPGFAIHSASFGVTDGRWTARL
jgi:iron complex outermembrane recepter protein